MRGLLTSQDIRGRALAALSIFYLVSPAPLPEMRRTFYGVFSDTPRRAMMYPTVRSCFLWFPSPTPLFYMGRYDT